MIVEPNDSQTFKKISPIDLCNDLQNIIKNLNLDNFEFIYPFIKEHYCEFLHVLNNLFETGNSQVIICYGNNHNLTKSIFNLLVKNILSDAEEIEENISVKTINFNAYIHEREEYVLSTLCSELGLTHQSNTFDKMCKQIEEFFNDEEFSSSGKIDNKILKKNLKRNKEKEFFIIFYENIEHLFHKQKQVLFYTILELVNNSKNILFVGTTNNFNLNDLMEKRIRSRFSQKTYLIDISSVELIFNSYEFLFKYKKNNDGTFEETEASGNFYDLLKNNMIFSTFIQKQFAIGKSIKSLIFQTRLFLSNLTLVLKNYHGYLNPFELQEIIEEQTTIIFKESRESYQNILKRLSKIHITVLVALMRSMAKFKENIYAVLIYQEYIYLSQKSGAIILKIDVFKKILEDLYLLNIIHMRKDDRYTHVFEIKYHFEELKKLLLSLGTTENENNFDYTFKSILSNIQL